MSEQLGERAATPPRSAEEGRQASDSGVGAASQSDASVGSRADRLSGKRLGFLYNHDALHQVAHSAPMIGQLAREHPALEITILASSEEQTTLLRQQLPEAVCQRISFVLLRLPAALERIDRLARSIAPFRRVAILRSNLDVLRRFDALVVPEATSSMLKTRFGLEHMKLIYTHHGAGDRSVGFGEELQSFDLVLVPGPKIRDRLMSLDLIEEGGYAMVGYPKFDAVDAVGAPARPLFPNDNPTVLYNPHFEPRLSSWYDMGFDVIDYFADTPRYNLVVAPHVMLFQRRVHTSLESLTIRLRRKLPERYLMHDNIHIDLGSANCIDMTYTLGADVYLGDVSSQVYEFLLRPRPCIFLNAHAAQWENDENYLHWTCGPVLQNVEALDAALAKTSENQATYRSVQESLFARTIDISEVPSARRAANAIAEFLAR